MLTNGTNYLPEQGKVTTVFPLIERRLAMRRHGWLLIIVLLLPFLLDCGGGPRPHTAYDTRQLGAEIRSSQFDIPIVPNERTAAWIEFYQSRGRKQFTHHLERSSRYLPLMRAILKEHGLPQDLVYVALIESGFSAHAYSRAHAVGFWQFIRGTARRYRLVLSPYIDERRDFEKSTHAAATYLKELYQRFGDWHLAMAAYNAGEGKIERAITRHGTKDYWRLIHYSTLRPETKDYIAKFQAAALIAKHPEKYGFDHLEYEAPLEYETVTVKGPVDLRIAAKLAKAKHEELADLNPELNRWFTPPDRPHYALRVPQGSGQPFESRYASLPRHKFMASKIYHTKEGDSLDSIAKNHDLPLDFLAMANGISEKGTLEIGKAIGIPDKPPAGMKGYLGHYKGEDRERIRHKVRAGESLWAIARHYRVSVRDLQQANHGRIGKYLKPGQILSVHAEAGAAEARTLARKEPATARGSETISYRVKRGDTLGAIAVAHRVGVGDLKRWNQGKLGKYLQTGQKLVIYPRDRVPIQLAANQPEPEVKAAAAPAEGTKIYHTVQSGDTLWDIARKYRVSTQDLKAWNRIEQVRRLRPGDKLKIFVQPATPQEA